MNNSKNLCIVVFISILGYGCAQPTENVGSTPNNQPENHLVQEKDTIVLMDFFENHKK